MDHAPGRCPAPVPCQHKTVGLESAKIGVGLMARLFQTGLVFWDPWANHLIILPSPLTWASRLAWPPLAPPDWWDPKTRPRLPKSQA